MVAIPDVTVPATVTSSGKAVAILQSQPYHRNITNIYVQNPAGGGVSIYRGSLNATASTGNPIGDRQNVSGSIVLPPGQQLFVVWDTVPNPLSLASARVSAARVDTPLDVEVADSGSLQWDINAISQLVIPTGATTGARIVLNGTTGQILVYNSSNVVVAEIDSSGIIQTFSSIGDHSGIQLSDGVIQIAPSNSGVGSFIVGRIKAAVAGTIPQMTITSPTQNNSSPNGAAVITLGGAESSLSESIVSLNADQIQLTGFNNSVIDVGGPETGTGGVSITGNNASQIGVDLGGVAGLFLNTAGFVGKICTFLKSYDASSNLTLGGAQAVIPGCDTGTDLNGQLAGAVWAAFLSCDSTIGAVAGVTNFGRLLVDNVAYGHDMAHATGVNTRSQISRFWSGTFTAGNHKIQGAGLFTGGGGVNAFFSPGTTLTVAVFQ